ncbi:MULTISPECIES: hypothetical protein [unclassified Neptuniibacter]|uniref:hypothetical protein n=1 Tax=unclassified Neptuniibacter TaxID=2630693 RepID=UPI0025CB94FD|nr:MULTISPECIES: hypothetical protein [unclassified Neptuniibacter]|tara:strand:- start:18361 stop:19479 length:1119 start_codon:yes stop_codon:yes gene_type:complete
MDSDISYWFVGALWGGTDDQTERFLTEGVWENGYDDKHLELVKTIKPGDRIAIKASFTQKNDLPFQSNGSTASVMAIKARGCVTSNEGDGRRISVDWEPLTPEKRWYFFTHRGTIWHVKTNRWLGKGLIDFTFNNVEQDYDRFRNDPYWIERFGDNPNDTKFPWTKFYEEFATKLLNHKDDRAPLVDKLHEISQQVDGFTPLNDKGDNDAVFAIKDICPFTIMGTFNRGITDSNRKAIARKLAGILGVESEIPTSFDGIPVLNNQKSWFFAYEYERAESDIDKLWDVFDAAINFSDGDADEFGSHFADAYDTVTEVKNVGWNLTMGLYWIRPWTFLPLDGNSQRYVQEKLGTSLSLKMGLKGDVTQAITLRC